MEEELASPPGVRFKEQIPHSQPEALCVGNGRLSKALLWWELMYCFCLRLASRLYIHKCGIAGSLLQQQSVLIKIKMLENEFEGVEELLYRFFHPNVFVGNYLNDVD